MVTKNTKIKAHSDPAMDFDSDEEEPDFSDPEDFVDDINDEDLLEDVYRERPAEADGLENVIVVDNIPIVGPGQKFDKLKNVFQKLFKPFGEVSSWEFPVDEEGNTKGFIFIEYKNANGAQMAVTTMNNHKLDKSHTLIVCPFTDFQKYENLSEEWRPPVPQPYVSHGNLSYHLLESDCRDQFVVTYEGAQKVGLYLHGFQEDTVLLEREHFSDLPVMWSPKGNYLATFHDQGIQLWGSEKWEKIGKFKHNKVRFLDFSPCERYMVTFNDGVGGGGGGRGGSNDDFDDRKPTVIVWDVLTGQKRRSFQPSEDTVWPMFKWSHDDRYFARQTEDHIQIYETPSCGLLDKKSYKVAGVRAFSWCPTANIMAFWVAEDRDVPAKVSLIEIPSRTELRSKVLFNVADCKMVWQKSGDYLAVKVDRYQKSRRENNITKYSGIYFNFEVFMIKEKNFPVDSVELKDAPCVTSLSWEPNGSKFAVVHGEGQQTCVSFYQVKSATVTLLKRMEKKTCNRLLWSPNGQFIVLAGLKQLNGFLEFVDTSADFTVMNTTEHFRCTDVDWDPTGRYVVSAVSAWAGDRTDNGYWIWSFQGKILRKAAPTGFCGFMWRPRPRSILTEENIKEIKRNFKKYQQQFEVKDRASMSKVSKDIMEKRQKLMEAYRAWQADKKKKLEDQKEKRCKIRGGVDTDTLDAQPDELEEETLFVLIKEESVPLPAA